MGIDQLTRRIVAAPRYVVFGLVALSALISPGFVRISRDSALGLAPERAGSEFAARETAVLELACPDGVFTSRCAQRVANVTDALEQHADVFASVRSLANARVVRAEHGALRLEALAPDAGGDALADPWTVHARVRYDDALLRRYVAPSARETFVYADLASGHSAREASVLVASLRADPGSAAGEGVTLLGVGRARSMGALLLGAALALGLLALGLAPGGWRVAALASGGALALAAFGHALLGLLGEPAHTLASFAPELLVASALSSSFALIQRSRAEHRRGRSSRTSVASALALVGPELAVGAIVSVSGLAALLALAPGIARSLALGAASAMAAALVAYPLGVTLAGLVSWPGALSRARGELAAVLARRAEHVVVRARLVAAIAALGLALAVTALAALAPDPSAVQLETVVLDSGARGGALEPQFLERVAEFQREAASRPGVVWSSSLVDSVLAPANRALHDGDALFATVPLTRIDVVRALEPWLRDAHSALARQIDSEQRRLAVELYVVPSLAGSVPLTARALASTLLAVVLAGALGAAVLRSARGGLLCALPAALTGGVVLGLASAFAGGLHGAGAALAPLAAATSAALGLQFLVRVRSLLELGSQLEVALSLALRETGPALASAALASSAVGAALGASSVASSVHVVLACLSPVLGATSALLLLPALVRAFRGRYFATRVALRADVSAVER